MGDRHTLLLLQSTKSKNTRTFTDYPNPGACWDGICNTFEQKLKELNPTTPQISYEIQDIYNYIDSMVDMVVLIFSGSKLAYEPYDREYIKKQLYQHLKRQVAR